MKRHIFIFDFDGTLADTFNFLVEISNHLSKEFKFKRIHPDEIPYLKERTVTEVIRHLDVPVLKIPAIMARAKRQLHEKIFHVEPINGLREVLLELKKQKSILGILTTNSLANVKKFTSKHQMECFDFVSPSSRLMGKSGRLKTLIHSHGFRSDDVIYVGDEVRDIDAAKEAGIKSAAVMWGYNSPKALKQHQPDYIINKPLDLLKIIHQT
jgi:phosphoglycolate phosphatase-like HAD superfamily hydrolase